MQRTLPVWGDAEVRCALIHEPMNLNTNRSGPLLVRIQHLPDIRGGLREKNLPRPKRRSARRWVRCGAARGTHLLAFTRHVECFDQHVQHAERRMIFLRPSLEHGEGEMKEG